MPQDSVLNIANTLTRTSLDDKVHSVDKIRQDDNYKIFNPLMHITAKMLQYIAILQILYFNR